jgi:hypothetical protein
MIKFGIVNEKWGRSTLKLVIKMSYQYVTYFLQSTTIQTSPKVAHTHSVPQAI